MAHQTEELARFAEEIGASLGRRDGVRTRVGRPKFSDQRQGGLAALIVEVSNTTSALAGDGSATTALLAQAIYSAALRHGGDPSALEADIGKAAAAAVGMLKALAKPEKDKNVVARVVTELANPSPQHKAIVSEVISRASIDTAVFLGESQGGEDDVDSRSDIQIRNGFLSPLFITDAYRGWSIQENADLLLCTGKFSTATQVQPIIAHASRTGRPFLLVGEVEGEALAALVLSHLRGVARLCAVKPSGFGEGRKDELGDIAVYTRAKVVHNPPTDIASVIGQAEKIVVERDLTHIVGGNIDLDATEARINEITRKSNETKSDYELEKLTARLFNVSRNAILLHFEDPEDSEVALESAEDTLRLIYGIKEEGVLVAGACALLDVSAKLDPAQGPGFAIMREALGAPFDAIARNSGLDPATARAEAQKRGRTFGVNVQTGKVEDLAAAGVVDSAKAIRMALEYAAAAAGAMLAKPKVVDQVIDRLRRADKLRRKGAA